MKRNSHKMGVLIHPILVNTSPTMFSQCIDIQPLPLSFYISYTVELLPVGGGGWIEEINEQILFCSDERHLYFCFNCFKVKRGVYIVYTDNRL